MSKESVLTQLEKDSIEIEKFIFHIIIENEFNPIFLDEVILTEEQTKFFKNRFIDASEGTQFEFNNKKTSDVYKYCKSITENEADNFIEISKFLTASFKSHHGKTTNDGVFITSFVKVRNNVKLIFLIKLDNKKVYEYKIKGKKAIMEEIKNTFVEDKKSIQKIAIVDVSDYFIWDVLAFDRNPSKGKAIRDYFSNFLAVHERETPAVLTVNTVKAVRQWALANKENLDPKQEISSYKQRCVDYLKSNKTVKSKSLLNSIVLDEDDKREKILKNSLKLFLEEKGIYGQEFQPNINSLSKAVTKNTRKTAEGILIEWEGDAKDVNITIPNEPSKNDGLFHILIKTSRIDIEK